MNSQILAQTIIKTPYRGRTNIICQLIHHEGNTYPYFSFTTDRGTDHETIKKVYPQLEKFLPLHLANAKGAPWHCLANAKYFLDQQNYTALQRHLNLSEKDCATLAGQYFASQKRLEVLEEFISKLRPGWKILADECREWMEANPEIDLLNNQEYDIADDYLLKVGADIIQISDWYTEGYLPELPEVDYLIAVDSTEAGEAAIQYWRDLQADDPEEFICLIGQQTLIDWAVGKSSGPGSEKGSSFEDWLNSVVAYHPEEQWASYDGEEVRAYVNENLAEVLNLSIKLDDYDQDGWAEVVVYKR